MIGIDTNILVYAHREDSPQHSAARAALPGLVESDRVWAVPWACVHEFLAIVTHPRIYAAPTTTGDELAAIRTFLAEGGGRTLGEADDHLERLEGLLRAGGVQGARVHDARVAAVCQAHGVSELWTADRDFSYFPALRTRNPRRQRLKGLERLASASEATSQTSAWMGSSRAAVSRIAGPLPSLQALRGVRRP